MKRLEMCSAVMKGLRYADTQVSCVEACKRSHMGCSACYMVDLLILRNRVFWLRNFQILLVLSWEVAVLFIFTNSVFKPQNVQIWTVKNCKWFYLLIVRNGIFRSRNVQIITLPLCKRVNLLLFTSSVCRVRNVKYG